MLATVLVPLLVLVIALVALGLHFAPRFLAVAAQIADSLDDIAEAARRRPPPSPPLPFGGDLVRAVRITHDRVNDLDRRWFDVARLRDALAAHLDGHAAPPDDATEHPADKPDEHTESNP